MNSNCGRLIVLSLIGLSVVAGGCRRGPGADGMTDFNGPTKWGEGDGGGGGGGDIPLGARTELGTPVRDVVFANVQFAYDSFQVADAEVQKVQAVADYMKRNSSTKLVVEGNCDERGSREYNLSLGEHRSLAVRAHLVGLGIDGARIQTKSYGEESPLDPGHTENAWWMNRRAEFKMYR